MHRLAMTSAESAPDWDGWGQRAARALHQHVRAGLLPTSWLPGMALEGRVGTRWGAWRVLHVRADAPLTAAPPQEGQEDLLSEVEEPRVIVRDPATQGCLLSHLRQVHGCPGIALVCAPRVSDLQVKEWLWEVRDLHSGARLSPAVAYEAYALILALEQTPGHIRDEQDELRNREDTRGETEIRER